ncbi:carbohydrate ABC transporter permease [Streptomyces beigongshangae]|uniref:carbohydrate ABC transporter permease n=1 Tax=Streptomyces beigongshangae TaxID=2841597 RepID=UPI0021A91AC9|nr:sugar ABC transporter permease [Streptomyces sp. REN17]
MTNRPLPDSVPSPGGGRTPKEPAGPAAAPAPVPAGLPGAAPGPVPGPASPASPAATAVRPAAGPGPVGSPSSGAARRGTRPGRGGPGRRSPLARGGWTPWLYLAPALVVIGGLLVYPVYQLGLISFLEYTQAQVSGGQPTTFQGLGNYAALFRDEQFWQVLLATVVFAAACVVSTLAVGCALAVLLTRVRAVPRLALMLAALGAWATPAVTGSTVWLLLFDPDFGPVNRVLGLGDHSWTYDRYSAFALVLLEVVWCSFPFVMVTVYAGIRAVPSEVLEAASLDGASQWRIWRSVLAPMLRPILVVVTIQSVIWDFKVFTQIYVMTNGGGIAGQNLVLNVYAYQKAFASSQYSLGSAIGVVMLLILLAVTLVYLRLLRRQGEEL